MARHAQRRRRRSGRRAVPGDEVIEEAREAAPIAPILSRWNWRTLPVFAAFSAGIIVMGLFASSGLAYVVFAIGIFGAALTVAHMVRLQVMANRRR